MPACCLVAFRLVGLVRVRENESCEPDDAENGFFSFAGVSVLAFEFGSTAGLVACRAWCANGCLVSTFRDGETRASLSASAVRISTLSFGVFAGSRAIVLFAFVKNATGNCARVNSCEVGGGGGGGGPGSSGMRS